MSNETKTTPAVLKKSNRTLIGLLKPYKRWIVALVLFALISNAFNLMIPMLLSKGVDSFAQHQLNLRILLTQFVVVTLSIFIFAYLQSIVQTYVSERVARDVRKDVSAKISKQSYAFVQETTPAKLLTNLTSDVDAIKNFVSLAIVSIVSSLFLIIGASVLLLMLNWKLALAVLAVIPIIGGAFFFIFRKVRTLFKKSQEIIDWLNKVINESILGSALIRVLNSQQYEYEKFIAANSSAKDLGLQILRMFASLIPLIALIANMATLIILLLGGHFVINGTMTLGEFTAFNSYLAILIFPIIMIGFMSTLIARATASYQRIAEVLDSQEKEEAGKDTSDIHGDIDVEHVSMVFGEKSALKDVSFSVKARTKTAIIGPTGAGKTQLLYLLTGLMPPTSGTVKYDGKSLEDYDMASLHRQIGLVFEDSVMFNLTIRENIAFGDSIRDEDLQKAIDTAELKEFLDALPQGLDTIVSERGTSLSGGQKQRIMLARALSLNPKVLLLDDFTARVDTQTEQKILANVAKNYPDITLVSITQKIASVESFDHIILLMEGELLAQGTHNELMHHSPEYVQIAQSQRSTSEL